MRMLSIGADPEVFVRNDAGITSVIGHLGGSKYEPRMLNGFGLQEDNVLAEFSMPPVPYYLGAEQFSASVLKGVRSINAEVKKKGLRTTKGSSHRFSAAELRSFGPKALEFGCDPDRNAYTADWNPTPAADSTIRTAGGHVHLGLDRALTNDDTIARMMCKAMDLYVGIPSVLLDEDTERRELYGKAGAYRQKPYGIEYRTLSNFWIHKDNFRKWVFHASEDALLAADNINLRIKYFGEQLIQDCINESNTEIALDIVRKMNLRMPVGVNYAQAA